MTKYTIETKRKLVELVEGNTHSISSAAHELRISNSIAKRWMKMYEFYGYEGLLRTNGTYTGEFKVAVVEYMHQKHLSISEASA